jgi:hypothetical protein
MAEPTRRLAPAPGKTPHKYTPSYATDIRATFKRLAREQRQQAKGVQS